MQYRGHGRGEGEEFRTLHPRTDQYPSHCVFSPDVLITTSWNNKSFINNSSSNAINDEEELLIKDQMFLTLVEHSH